jgi:hypothetical protein
MNKSPRIRQNSRNFPDRLCPVSGKNCAPAAPGSMGRPHRRRITLTISVAAAGIEEGIRRSKNGEDKACLFCLYSPPALTPLYLSSYPAGVATCPREWGQCRMAERVIALGQVCGIKAGSTGSYDHLISTLYSPYIHPYIPGAQPPRATIVVIDLIPSLISRSGQAHTMRRAHTPTSTRPQVPIVRVSLTSNG